MTDQEQVHDKCKHVIVFHNHLMRFLKTLSETCPEYKHPIAKSLKYYKKNPRVKYITKVKELMESHINRISQYDEGIFSNDYHKGPLKLLPGLDFKEIFNLLDEQSDYTREQRNETKKHLFNHLQSLYISGELALQQINQFDEAMAKQQELLVNMIKNLNLDKHLKKRMDQLEQEDKDNEANQGLGGMLKSFGIDGLNGLTGLNEESMQQLGSILGEDNIFTQIAHDVASELNLEQDFNAENPVDAITKLFANNGQKLQEIIFTLTDKIEQKIKSGDISQETLTQQATSLRERFSSIPGLGNLMNQIEQGTAGTEQMKSMILARYQELAEAGQGEEFKEVLTIVDQEPNNWTSDQVALIQQLMMG